MQEVLEPFRSANAEDEDEGNNSSSSRHIVGKDKDKDNKDKVQPNLVTRGGEMEKELEKAQEGEGK